LSENPTGSKLSGPKLSGPMSPPRKGPPEHIIVLLHGYGADGNDLIGLAGQWHPHFPGALIVSPHAPEPCDQAPMGRQWFALDLVSMAPDPAGVQRATAAVNLLLADLWAQTGLAAKQTTLIGFSQGAMLALHVGLRQSEPLAGIVAFSGLIADPNLLESEIASRPPVCLAHGELDPVVPVEGSRAAARVLEKLGVETRLHISPGQGHTITREGLDFATTFMGEVLPA